MKHFAAFLLFFSLPSQVKMCFAQERLTSAQLLEGISQGRFAAVIDVRRQAEWDSGHVENATLVENLASDPNADVSVLLGCENCTLAVMCQTGGRAAQAILQLQNRFNFTGPLYNGLGVSQWASEGYPLVVGPSRVPSCDQDAACPAASATATPTSAPSISTLALTNSPVGLSLTAAPVTSSDLDVIDEDNISDDLIVSADNATSDEESGTLVDNSTDFDTITPSIFQPSSSPTGMDGPTNVDSVSTVDPSTFEPSASPMPGGSTANLDGLANEGEGDDPDSDSAIGLILQRKSFLATTLIALSVL